MATLFLNFTTPLPNNQQSAVRKNLQTLGFTTDRIFQNGEYIKWHYRGRLPTFPENDKGINGKYFFCVNNADEKYLEKITHVEFDLYFERKNQNEN